MFEEWESFFRNFTNALTLPSDTHSSIVYPNNYKGNQLIETQSAYEDSEDDVVLNIHHDLDDSESPVYYNSENYSPQDFLSFRMIFPEISTILVKFAINRTCFVIETAK